MTRAFPGLSLAVLVAALSTVPARAADPDLAALASAYLQAREATMQESARAADVDKALASCAPSLVYEHPRVGIRIEGLADVRAGMVRFLGTSRSARLTIGSTLTGAGMAAVQTKVTFDAKDGSSWRPVERQQVWVFEFEGSKIKRILEYW